MGWFRSCLLHPQASLSFRTAVPFWGQTTQILSKLSPKRDCGPKRVNASLKIHCCSIMGIMKRIRTVFVVCFRVFQCTCTGELTQNDNSYLVRTTVGPGVPAASRAQKLTRENYPARPIMVSYSTYSRSVTRVLLCSRPDPFSVDSSLDGSRVTGPKATDQRLEAGNTL